jgi:predicted alpha-1,2-mannosidase
VKAHFDFETAEGEEILIKFALSGVSTQGALNNLVSEIPHWDFDQVRDDARKIWDEELSRIEIDAGEDRKVNFYTALYHCFLGPVVYSDVTGEYRGLDQNIHRTDGSVNYTIFSLWDTYRALHPLLTILQKKRTNDIIASMLAHYDESVHGILPVWSHYSNDNWCMIGYHAVPVIVDAFMKGIRDYDVKKAFEASVSSATYEKYDGIGYYERFGFVPEDLNANSASKTLEYAYDDWTIYRMAAKIGRDETAGEFRGRAGYYRNLFDAKTGFMRARNSDGAWKTPFDPLSTSGQGYIEGNAWNYSLYVPHDVAGLIELMGGEDRFVSRLDSLFSMEIPDESIAHSEDIEKVGIIGNYVHGNEPSHHIPYLYCYAGAPWKTQERIHRIVDAMYRNTPDGLCGNDDCGQMSAWYVFSSLGLYPVCPGSNEYVFGSPCVNRATIRLENGKSFSIRAHGLNSRNIYIQSVMLNGTEYAKGYLDHGTLEGGGELVFVMGPEPNRIRATAQDDLPYSMSGRRR